jgi:Fic family protein
MKFETYQAGKWLAQYQYKSFEPVLLNHEWSWEDAKINFLLESATRALGELNAFSLIVPDVDLFIQMHIAKEAQTSSKIEGTQTDFNEVLLAKEYIPLDKRDDWQEVHNYIDAINHSIQQLKDLPFSNRLLKDTHRVLMQGVRGEGKQPGEFRKSQNWIGGSSLSDASFIPPHQSIVTELMSDLEHFLHNESLQIPYLIKAAIAHYQFETIHPFLDGNGRIGRLMIPLYLISKGLLSKPSLYLSDFFERHRSSYYDALMRVRLSNDLIHWVRFFLKGVLETSLKGRDTFFSILQLRTEIEAQILHLGKQAPNLHAALQSLYKQPLTTAPILSRVLAVSNPTTQKIIKTLVDMNVLTETTGQLRDRIYVFERYLKVFAS